MWFLWVLLVCWWIQDVKSASFSLDGTKMTLFRHLATASPTCLNDTAQIRNSSDIIEALRVLNDEYTTAVLNSNQRICMEGNDGSSEIFDCRATMDYEFPQQFAAVQANCTNGT